MTLYKVNADRKSATHNDQIIKLQYQVIEALEANRILSEEVAMLIGVLNGSK